MAKVVYNLTLVFRGSDERVQGFTARVQEWGPPSPLLFKETPVHQGTDKPLTIELDAVKPPTNGVAKLTVTGPATGVDGDPITYQTNLALWRWWGGDIVLEFEKCPRIGRQNVASPLQPTAASEPSDSVPGDVLAELFLARDAAEKGVDDTARDKMIDLARRAGLDLSLLQRDWYGRSDLACATVRVHFAAKSGKCPFDATAELYYYGKNVQPLKATGLVGCDFKNPAVIHARASNDRALLTIRETGGAGRVIQTEVDMSQGETHEVVVPLIPPVQPKLHKKYIDAPAKIEWHNVDDTYMGEVDPVFIRHGIGDKHHSSRAHSIWVECEKHATNWIAQNIPNAQDPRMICLWSRSFLTFELAETGYYKWEAFRWTEDNGRGEPIDSEKVRVDRIYVEWRA